MLICFWIQICTKDQKQVLSVTANRKYEDEKGSKLCCFIRYTIKSIFVKGYIVEVPLYFIVMYVKNTM